MTKLYFPMKTLRVTQGSGLAHDGVPASTYSHAGGYALDLGGADGGADWLYAPCDMVVRRVYGSYNAVWFESLDEIDGVGSTVILLCLHMNNADREALGIKVGKVFKQGEKCYREGMSGNVTGTHVHIEVGKGPMRGTGWTQNKQGVWVINDPLVPSEVFVLKEDVKIMYDGGYVWMSETVNVLASEPVIMQCIASAGDQRILCAAMEGLGIGYNVNGVILTTLVPVSPGDQKALAAAANPLGIEWYVPVENALAAAEWRAVKAEKEAEELRAKLAETEELLKAAQAKAARAEEQSATFLQTINAVKAALGV